MRLKQFAIFVSLLAAQAASAASTSEVVGSAYHADVPFPQYLHLWSEGWALKDEYGKPSQYATSHMPLGAYVHLYIHNGSSNTLPVRDVKLQGVSLTDAVAFSDQKTSRLHPASIHFSKMPKADLDRLVAAGEPVWWKVEPLSLPPGGYGEVTVRLRRQPTSPLTLEVLAKGGTWEAQVQPADSPRFVGISFSPSLDTVFCYIRRPHQPGHAPGAGEPQAGTSVRRQVDASAITPSLSLSERAPAGLSNSHGSGNLPPMRVLLDGTDITARTTLAADPAVDVMPLVIRTPQPLKKASFHCFQAVFANGATALAGIRAWGDELVYGMWGYVNHGKTAQERVDYYLRDLQRHNVNAVMESYGGEVADYLSGESGVEHSRTTGIRAMCRWPGKILNPVYYFLTDEPDAHDYAVKQLPPDQRLGTLAQDLVRRSHAIRERDPIPPHLLNLDNTYKPENWYMYAQLPDVCCADPYYQEQERIVWNDRPAWAASFIKPTYVLGAATICNSACAPKPLHIILDSVRQDLKGGSFRFATPPEKTVELFYALGAGAKGFSYWWYTPYGRFHGCGASDKEAVALWRQIGLLGAQLRTAGPVITRSCPATVPLKAPAKLWTRTLLAGTDTLVLVAVNEDIANDRLGTVVVPLPKTPVTLTPPSWLKTADAFEVTPEGLHDVTWKTDAGQIRLHLGKTEVARLVLLTADKTLRGQLAELYRSRFAANVAQLAAAAAK